jgi:hypothetical protein
MSRHPKLVRRSRNRAAVALAILLAWGLGVGMLVRQEYFRERSAVLAEAALRLAPGVSFFVVEQGGRQVGFASTTIDTSLTTFEVVDYFIADVPVAGREVRASARSVITLSRSLALRSFDVELETGAAPMRVGGVADGDSAVTFVIDAPGQSADSQRVDVDGPILLPTLIPAVAMLTGDPEVGRTVAVPTFDPATRTSRDVLLRFEAESLFTTVDSATFDSTSMRFVAALTDTVRAWHLVPDDATAGGFDGWVDTQGRVVQSTQPGGYVLRRIAYEIAFENWRRDRADAGAGVAGTGTGADPARGILEGTAIAAGVRPRADGPRAMRVRLAGASLAGFDLNGGRQQLRGDTLVVEREADALLDADWTLGRRTAGFGLRFAPELRAEPLLQVTDRAITELAVRLAGNDRDPRVVAERIGRWVHDSLAKSATVTVPNAVQVLRTRRGDAGEHAQLFTALARAVGIPTRIATGLLYVDGTFHYHAWPEVRLRDWVAVDPTFGQFPADAAHLRFVRGALTRQGELLRLVGNLRIEVLPTR